MILGRDHFAHLPPGRRGSDEARRRCPAPQIPLSMEDAAFSHKYTCPGAFQTPIHMLLTITSVALAANLTLP